MTMERINDILIKMSFLDRPPAEDMTLKGDLGLDSLKVVELIVALEDEFNIVFNESDLDPNELETVGSIYALVNKYVKGDKDVV